MAEVFRLPDQSLWAWAKTVVEWAKEAKPFEDESWRHAALKMASKVLADPHVEGECKFQDRVAVLEENALAALKELATFGDEGKWPEEFSDTAKVMLAAEMAKAAFQASCDHAVLIRDADHEECQECHLVIERIH